MNSNSKALKSGLWYTISNFFLKSIGFILTPIFTRLLTHSDFGMFNNYNSWLGIITIIVTLNLESTLISARFDYEDDMDGYIVSMLALSSISTLFWIIVINFFKSFFISLFSLNIKYINAMLVYLLFLPAVNMFLTKERFLFEYKKTIIISIVLSLSTAILSVCLVVIMTDKLTGRILGAVVPTVIIGGIIYVYFLVKNKKIKSYYWKYAIPICLPYIPHLLSMTLLNSTDRVMITKICGPEKTSLYSLAYTCGSMITLLITSLNGAFAPWLGEKLNKKEYSDIRDFSYLYISVFFGITIGIMLLSPEVLLLLGGKSYLEAVYVLTPVSIGNMCLFLYTMFVNVEQYRKKTKGMAVGSLTAAIVNIVLNIAFIPKIGYLAAAYTTLIGYIVLLLIHMYLVQRLKLNEIYDYGFVCSIVFMGIMSMIIITFLYSHIALRITLIFMYVIIMFFIFMKNKNKIVLCFKRK